MLQREQKENGGQKDITCETGHLEKDNAGGLAKKRKKKVPKKPETVLLRVFQIIGKKKRKGERKWT